MIGTMRLLVTVLALSGASLAAAAACSSFRGDDATPETPPPAETPPARFCDEEDAAICADFEPPDRALLPPSPFTVDPGSATGAGLALVDIDASASNQKALFLALARRPDAGGKVGPTLLTTRLGRVARCAFAVRALAANPTEVPVGLFALRAVADPLNARSLTVASNGRQVVVSVYSNVDGNGGPVEGKLLLPLADNDFRRITLELDTRPGNAHAAAWLTDDPTQRDVLPISAFGSPLPLTMIVGNVGTADATEAQYLFDDVACTTE